MSKTDGHDLPAGWRWISFSKAAEHRSGKMLGKRKNVGTLRPYLRNVNVRWHGFDLAEHDTRRRHTLLGFLTPAAHEARYHSQHALTLVV